MSAVEPISIEEGRELTRRTMYLVIVWTVVFIVAAVGLILVGDLLAGLYG